MQDVKISQLPTASSVAAADQMPIVQSGTTKQITAGTAKNAKGIYSGAGAPSLSAPNGSIYMRSDGTADTTLYVRSGGAWSAVSSGTPPVVPVPPIPSLALWESHMVAHPDLFNAALLANAINAGFSHNLGQTDESQVWYYDGTLSAQQIANYSGNASYYGLADNVKNPYLNWVNSWITEEPPIPDTNLNQQECFTHGVLNDWLRTGNANSRLAVHKMAQGGSYAGSGGSAAVSLMRETSYALMGYVSQTYAGYSTLTSLINASVGFLKSQFDKIFVTHDPTSVADAQPFMMGGMAADALIHYHGWSGDGSVIPYVKLCADGLFNDGWWGPAGGYFTAETFIENRASPTQSWPTNLMLCHIYSWLWQQGYGDLYRQRFDQIFNAGVINGYLGGGKQFAQQHRCSFDGVKWRSAAPGTIQLYPARHKNAGIAPSGVSMVYDVGAYQT